MVYLLDEKKNVLVQKAAYGPKNPKDRQIINPIEIEIRQGIVGPAARYAKPELVKIRVRIPATSSMMHTGYLNWRFRSFMKGEQLAS